MLDFYLQPDSLPSLDYPNEDNHIGGLCLSEFRLLENVIAFAKTKHIHLHFYEDFRIKRPEVASIFEHVDRILQAAKFDTFEKEKAYRKLLGFMKSSLEIEECGILCFCD